MADMTATGAVLSQADQARVLRRVGLGVVVSLLLHALLMSAWHAPTPVAAPPAARPLAVRVLPPPQAETPPAPLPPAAPGAERVPRAAHRSPPRRVIAVPPTDSAPAPDPFTAQQPPAVPAAAPRFDPDAARRMARSLANMKDPAKEGTAIGQFPEKPLETETRAARAIGAARRPLCKDGLPGGLLGPLLILADKKDSGCKW